MFGNFLEQFGLNFQLPDQSPDSGLLGASAPQQGQPPLGGPAAPGGAGTGLNVSPPASTAAKAPPGITGGAGNITPPPGGGGQPQPTSPASFAAPQAAAPSPLGSPLAPGGGSGFQNQPASDPAPAAGVGSQFKQQGGF